MAQRNAFPIAFRVILVSILVTMAGSAYPSVAVARSKEKVVELKHPRLLATSKLLAEFGPKSKNYTVRLFSFLDEVSCDSEGPCEVFGIAVAAMSDGELPEVAAKSICCFASIGPPRQVRIPNTVEGASPALIVTDADRLGGSVRVEIEVRYKGPTLDIDFRVARDR